MLTLKNALLLLCIFFVSTAFSQGEITINDDCSNALLLPVGSSCVLDDFTSIGATSEPPEIAPNPGCGGFQGGDVWFSFEVPASGNFRIEMNSSGNNAQWELYSGTCGDFTALACASTGNQLGKNFVEPSLAGETLYLRSWRFLNDDGIDFSLCIWEITPPVNDNCADAIALAVGETCILEDFSSQYAVSEPTETAPNPGCGGFQGGDVWFSFEVPASGNFRIEMNSSANNSQWELYSGTCGDFTALSCASTGNQVRKNFAEPDWAGETLYLRSWRFLNDDGIDFSLCIWEIEPPVNDQCANAINLSVGEICVPEAFSSQYATAQSTDVAPNPTCGGYQGGDIWFTFEAPESGNFRIEMSGAGNNSQWELYSGTCGDFIALACASTGNQLSQNFIEPDLAGETLYLRSFRFLSPQGIDFTLCISELAPPENNDCSNATSLVLGEECTPQEYSTLYATAESESVAPDPTCGGYQGGDVWFSFEVPETGNFRVESAGIGASAQWSLYSGSCGNFSEILCATGNRNFSDPTLANQTVYLRFFRFLSPQAMDFTLCVSETTPPENNNCADATFIDADGNCVYQAYSSLFASSTPEDIAPEPNCGLYVGSDIWFAFEAPESGAFSVNRNNLGNGNAHLAFYTGTCGDFTEISCSGDVVNDFNDPDLGGETIYIRAWRFNSAEATDFELCISFADCNGDFGGDAFTDNCGTCVGGNTGLVACEEDCNGEFGGEAFTDNCGSCVGGNTGEVPCEQDCNGEFGGEAFFDNCGTCVGGNTGLVACEEDCNGDFGSDAFTDNCGSCVGGNTGEEPCEQDCNGDFGGEAFTDNCGTCVGGNTGEEPCEQDCNGDFGGDAFTDNCGTCVGGNTGEEPCEED
ncbi:MAG: hypothetical protein LC664_06400, partial [Flavobacteriales bacterium]|nr:hypothetical protein [Flavobacteriales bacterium]